MQINKSTVIEAQSEESWISACIASKKVRTAVRVSLLGSRRVFVAWLAAVYGCAAMDLKKKELLLLLEVRCGLIFSSVSGLLSSTACV